MLRNIIVPILIAIASITGIQLTRIHETSAAEACLMFLAGSMLVAIVAELVFHRRSSRFWCGVAFAGGICGAILCLINLVLFKKDGVDPLLWIVVTATIAGLLFPRLYPWLQMLRSLFVPVTLVNAGLLLWLCLLMAANLPWFYPALPPALERAPRTAQQERDMAELIRLLPKRLRNEPKGEIDTEALNSTADVVQQKLSTDLRPSSVKGLDLAPIAEDLGKVQGDLNKIWTFLAEHHPVAETELTSPVPDYLGIRSATQLEGLSLHFDVQEGKDIGPRLRRFFRGTKNWMGLNQWMITTMIGAALVLHGTEHLLALAPQMNQPDPELLRLLRATRESLTPALRNSLIVENNYMLHGLKNPELVGDPTELFAKLEHEAFAEGSLPKLKALMDRRHFYWPLHNERDTAHHLKEIREKDLAAIDAPTYLAKSQAFEDRSRAIELALATPPRLINLQRRSLYELFSSNWERAFQRIAVTEAVLAATEQLLINKWKLPMEPVINPLTGAPFVIGSDGSIRITDGLPAEAAERLKGIYAEVNAPLAIPYAAAATDEYMKTAREQE